MQPVTKFVTILLATSVLGGAYAAQATASNIENDAAGAKTAAVSMTAAVATALNKVPGVASRAEFETNDANGNALWQIEVVSDKGVTDVEVDATTGQVIKQAADKADQDETTNEDDAKAGKEDEAGPEKTDK